MKEVIKLNEEIREILLKMNINVNRSVDNDGENILKCFLKGYQMNIAKRQIDLGKSDYDIYKEYNLNIIVKPIMFYVVPNASQK